MVLISLLHLPPTTPSPPICGTPAAPPTSTTSSSPATWENWAALYFWSFLPGTEWIYPTATPTAACLFSTGCARMSTPGARVAAAAPAYSPAIWWRGYAAASGRTSSSAPPEPSTPLPPPSKGRPCRGSATPWPCLPSVPI